jgi:hypothetical protein
MLSFKFLAAVLVPLAVSAVPVRRGADPSTLHVLREYFQPLSYFNQFGGLSTSSGFAMVLESLDTAFYEGLLDRFKVQDFINAGFISGDLPIDELTTIKVEEGTHATALAVCTDLGSFLSELLLTSWRRRLLPSSAKSHSQAVSSTYLVS